MEIKLDQEKIYLKSCLPKLNPGKVYRIEISYKDELNMYTKLNVNSIFALVHPNGKIYFYSYVSEMIPTKYVNQFRDYSIFGSSKKKLFIKETRKSFFQIDIESSDSSMHQQVLICSPKNLDWKKELEKILSKYIYEIKDYSFYQEGSIYSIQVKIEIQFKKTLRYRIENKVSTILKWRKKYHLLN